MKRVNFLGTWVLRVKNTASSSLIENYTDRLLEIDQLIIGVHALCKYRRKSQKKKRCGMVTPFYFILKTTVAMSLNSIGTCSSHKCEWRVRSSCNLPIKTKKWTAKSFLPSFLFSLSLFKSNDRLGFSEYSFFSATQREVLWFYLSGSKMSYFSSLSVS